jgi:hypothetical protein
VTAREAEDFAAQHGVGYFEMSAKTGHMVSEAMEDLEERIGSSA